MATLLIDNYDSYTFNLYQLIAQVSGRPPLVIQNDDFEQSWEKLVQVLQPGVDFLNVVISPGPGSPTVEADVGLSRDVALKCTVPVFGVCLGHQLLASIHGAAVVRAKEPMHGRTSPVSLEPGVVSSMFDQISMPVEVVRYHSLVVQEEGLPECIKIVARSDCGTIMALQLDDPNRVVWGVQFHPESICTQDGDQLIRNFLRASESFWSNSSNLLDSAMGESPKIPSEGPALDRNQSAEVKTHTESFCVRVEKVDCFVGCPLTTETLFSSLYDTMDSKCRFWLDSATRSATDAPKGAKKDNSNLQKEIPALPRFSYMGDGCGPLAHLLEVEVDRTLRSFHHIHRASETPKSRVRVIPSSDENKWLPEVEDSTDPFRVLEDTLERVSTQSSFYTSTSSDKSPRSLHEWDLPFPFAGGYVGYFGYGLRQLCGVKSTGAMSSHPALSRKQQEEPAHNHGAAPLPRAQACQADAFVPDATFLFADRVLVWDHDTQECYLLAVERVIDQGDANCEHDSSSVQQHWLKQVRKKLEALDITKVANTTPGLPTSSRQPLAPAVDDGRYRCMVEECKELICSGETYEVCLTKQLSYQTPEPSSSLRKSAFSIYQTLRNTNPAPYAAFLDVSSGTSDFAVCCSSPERFLSVTSDRKVSSKPIKGTVRRGVDTKEDEALAEELRTSVKDRAENLMIVDLVRNDIGRVCEVGSVKVPKLMCIESFASVHQLVSTVEGKLRDSLSTITAIRAAFPGGSMTGAPKLRTMQIIDQIETDERGIYSGSLGYLSLTGACDLNIVIRTAVVTPAGVSVGAGGAIVALSDAQGEVDEAALKAQKLQTVMSDFVSNK